jgi:hypothetical protein
VFFKKTQPAAGAFVVFHAQSPAVADAAAARPFAYVQEDGSFRLTTYAEGDGAPVGEYGVTIVWESAPRSSGPRIREGNSGPDRLGGRYGDPQHPRLQATVQKGDTSLRFDVE